MSDFTFPDFYQTQRSRVDDALEHWLPDHTNPIPDPLVESMRYTVLAGGKRLRGVLVLEAARLGEVDPPDAAVRAVSAAVEMVHAYSLIHDDLPAMDDDDYRRGQPANHREFGEDQAILAGDALLNRAFEVLGELVDLGVDPAIQADLLKEFSQATGSEGLIGGQVLDLSLNGDETSEDTVREVHERKTGALIRGALGLGGRLARLDDEEYENLTQFGTELGLAFQVKDDLLEIDGDLDQLGKDPDSDRRADKSTVPAILGLESARDLLDELTETVLERCDRFPTDEERFPQLVDLVVNRDH